ncbi:MAG: hypothetical protein HQL87_02040 [Magnetococcales bacterium]|nr:hypothetical protein [Magnetococcales bacterium]
MGNIQQDQAEAHASLGMCLHELHCYETVYADCRDALHQWHAALLHLVHPSAQTPVALPTLSSPVPFPLWQGEDLTGKSLLIFSEHGFGDQIQFCRYVTRLLAAGIRWCTVVCDPPLVALLASLAGVDQVLVKGQDCPPHDFWLFYLSVPLHLATTPATIPDQIPYLHAPADRLARWEGLMPKQGFRVGLVWHGNPQHTNDANRSLPGLTVLAPLWSVPGVAFVSLQKGAGEKEASQPPPGQPILHWGDWIQDFADTAAIVTHLDLVISVDSAVAHLAGALGKPCWVMLPAVGTDWRWLHGRTDSPWYPGVLRLFHQEQPGEWSTVVQQIREALVHRVCANAPMAGPVES